MPEIEQEKPAQKKRVNARKQANLNDNGEATTKKRRTLNWNIRKRIPSNVCTPTQFYLFSIEKKPTNKNQIHETSIKIIINQSSSVDDCFSFVIIISTPRNN